MLFIKKKDGDDAIRIVDELQYNTLMKPPVKCKHNSTPLNPDLLDMSVDGEDDSTIMSPSVKKNCESVSSDDGVEEVVDPNAADVGGGRPQRAAKK